MSRRIFFICYNECDVDAWKYWRSRKKDGCKVTWEDEQRSGADHRFSLRVRFFQGEAGHGTVRPVLTLLSFAYVTFSIFHPDQAIRVGTTYGPHACKVLPGLFSSFSWEWGNGKCKISFCRYRILQLIRAVVTYALSGERMRLARALPPAAKRGACLTTGLAKCELMGPLSHHEGKKTEILLEIKCTKKEKKKSTEKFRRKPDCCSLLCQYSQIHGEYTSGFLLKQRHGS